MHAHPIAGITALIKHYITVLCITPLVGLGFLTISRDFRAGQLVVWTRTTYGL